MKLEPLFTGRDLELIESLTYNPDLKPGFDHIKYCLVWPDEIHEINHELSRDGYTNLLSLLAARGFIHRGKDFSSYSIAPEFFKDIWDRALAQKFNWPGFSRLELTEQERAFLEEQLNESETSEAI